MSILELKKLILQRTCGVVTWYLPLFGLKAELLVEDSSQLCDLRLDIEIVFGPPKYQNMYSSVWVRTSRERPLKSSSEVIGEYLKRFYMFVVKSARVRSG